jgi:ribosomal protein S5
LIEVPLVNKTIPYGATGRVGASKVLLKPA